ncbi:MAG TPA: tetratricopeptide repeat protein [Acidimicrobiia bacterium]|nr:tetratricopeptide repeat protein [Acidimicrobiia bacterium]
MPLGPEELLSRAIAAHEREDLVAAAADYQEFLRAHPSFLEPAAAVRVLCNAVEVHCVLEGPEKAEPLAAEAVRLARETDGSSLAWALFHAGYLAWRRENFSAAMAALEEALELARAADDMETLGPVLLNLARVSFDQGEWDRGRRLIDELMGLTTTGDALVYGGLHAQGIARESGDFEKAMSLAEAAWQHLIHRPVLQPARLLTALARRCDGAIDLGDLDRARSAVSQALQLAGRTERQGHAFLAAGALALEEENWTGAQSYFERAVAAEAGTHSHRGARLWLADALMAAGKHEDADKIIQAIKAEIAIPSPTMAASLLCFEGEISHTRGDLPQARAAYRQAWDEYRRIGYRASAAAVALDLGLVEADSGRMESAARYLSEATPLSGRPSYQRCRAELARRIA